MSLPTAVLLMAYGTAPSLDERDVRAFLSHILQFYRKADPTDEEVRSLQDRLDAAGGSPLYEITNRLAHAVQERLNADTPAAFAVRTAMKHSPPFVEDVVREIGRDGHATGVGVALAPFRSRLSTDGYYKVVREANASSSNPIDWSFAEDWNLHTRFIDMWEAAIRDGLSSLPDDTVVIFTNHSLPARIAEWNDPYPDSFQATARALAERLGFATCTTAYQSAGGGNQPWLGPDVKEVLDEWVASGHEHFLAAPIGFLMDHLEVTYDLDVAAKTHANQLGASFERTRMPNDDPRFVEMLVDVVRREADRRVGG